MRTELKVGLALLLVWLVIKFMRTDSRAKQIPALIEGGALLIDVRTAGEFAGGHIQGAINLPYDVIPGEIQKVEADQGRALIVYCLSGSRSGAAKRMLQRAGYTNVVNGGSYRSMRSRLKESI